MFVSNVDLSTEIKEKTLFVSDTIVISVVPKTKCVWHHVKHSWHDVKHSWHHVKHSWHGALLSCLQGLGQMGRC